MSNVQAHTGKAAALANRDLGAQAYATGNHVAFAGTPDLHTAAHEAAHVVQQRGGVQLKDGVGESGDAYEQHADAVADKVVKGESAAELLSSAHVGGASSVAAVQRKPSTGQVGPTGGGGGTAAVQRSPSKPAAPDPLLPPLHRLEAEDGIVAILERPVNPSDARALQQRKRELIEIFMAIPSADRSFLWNRLLFQRPDDRLALCFHYRLATPTRDELLRTLDGEPTPLPTAHDSIEPEAFLAGLDDAAIKLSPNAPKLAGYDVTTVVNAEIASALSAAEGHKTSLAWRLSTDDGSEYRSGNFDWPLGPPSTPRFQLEVRAGRSSLYVEIIVGGTVRKILRRLVEVGPKAVPSAGDVPGAVYAQVRDALSRKLHTGKHGKVDEALVDEMLHDLASIAPGYRAAVVAQLSGPVAGDDSLSALFLANVPANVRPRVIATLTSGRVELSQEAAEAEVGSHPLELDVTPRHPVIAPWMKAGARVRVTPKDPFASEALGLPADGPELEVFWTVDNEYGTRLGEFRTTWRHGKLFGEPLELEVPGPGVHKVTAQFSQQGLVGQQIQVDVPVVMERESELAAADQMDPEQALAERAAIRAQMSTDLALTVWGKSDLWMRAAALDASLAASGRTEQPPPVSDAERFAPESWLHHAGAANPALSTNRAHLRFVIEQRYKGPLDQMPPLGIALRAYVNDPRTEADNRTRAQAILNLVIAEESAMDEERTIFQRHFGLKGLDLCIKLLDQGEKEVYEKQREYGLGTGAAPDAADNVEALAEAASDLVPLQDAIEGHEKRINGLETRIATLDGYLQRPDLDDSAALDHSEAIGRMQTELTEEQKGLEASEKEFYVQKGELQQQYPILAIANVGSADKQRFDMGLLRKIAKGELGDVASKLEHVLKEIAKVRGEINEDTVWGVPDLLALTKQSLGITPGTFQNNAIENKLGLIRVGKIVTAVSQTAAAVLATIMTFGAAGPMVWVANGAMAMQGFYELGKSIREYQFEQALTGTHYDKAKALSQDDPSAFWLAFEIVTTAIGVFDVASAVKGMNEARKVFTAIRTARRAAAEVEDASKIARSLEELEHLASSRGLSAATQKRLRLEALEQMAKRVDEVGTTARAMLKGSEEFGAKATELHGAVKSYAGMLSDGKPVSDFKLEILSNAEFETRFGSKKGRAVFVMEEGKPTIYARLDARAKEVADEAAHVVQLGEPKLSADLKYLDEVNLADWKKMSVSDKMEFFQRKLNVEIDAKQRILAKLTDAEERAAAEANLADLQDLQKQVAGLTDEQLAQMNARILKEPEFLDQPSRAFAKRKVVVDLPNAPPRPQLGELDPHATPPREVSRTKGTADYSSAYGDKNVKSVRQHGDVWQERVIVTSGYEGRIKSVKSGKKGTIVSIETASGKLQRYTIEAGAEIPAEIKKGAPIAKDAVIGREVPRDYRWVEVENAEGKITRAEIRALDDEGGKAAGGIQRGKEGTERGAAAEADKAAGWIQRGREGTERGAAAEAEAMAEADQAIADAQKAGAKLYGKHVPHKVGGGGFDDVIVEFTHGADGIEARIRIREVKDYPNRHVPLGEFTALDENWAQNLKKLRDDVDEAVAGARPKGYEHFSDDELAAIEKTLDANKFEVEIRLGKTTDLGKAGHHASTTLPALEERVGRKIDVKKIGEGDR